MIIGICGFKGSGKSEVAKYLQEEYGFVRHNFKDALLSEVKKNFPDLLEEIYKVYNYTQSEDLFTIKPPLIRALLQNYGTELRRGENPNHWVDQWQKTLPKGNVVTDDVRFLNEAKQIQSGQANVLIRVVMVNAPQQTDTHQSEIEQLKFKANFVIEAEKGDIKTIQRGVDSIIKVIKENND